MFKLYKVICNGYITLETNDVMQINFILHTSNIKLFIMIILHWKQEKSCNKCEYCIKLLTGKHSKYCNH